MTFIVAYLCYAVLVYGVALAVGMTAWSYYVLIGFIILVEGIFASDELRKKETFSGFRAFDNLTLEAGCFALRLLLGPWYEIGVVSWLQGKQFGLLPMIFGNSDPWSRLLITVLVMDFATWFYHFISHKIRWVWHLHKVHHTDTAVNQWLVLRTHPLEIITGSFIRVPVILLLNPTLKDFFLYLVYLTFSVVFNHTNLLRKVPGRYFQALNYVFVTPRSHRIHHSDSRFAHGNYGFIFSLWDRAFKTYVEPDEFEKHEVSFGWNEKQRTHWLKKTGLLQPFFKE